ncbi:MAG: hypothetical protein PHS54_01510 [Clostridia bacterium]|nr:hypothetical protein [Clostridia bacterium]
MKTNKKEMDFNTLTKKINELIQCSPSNKATEKIKTIKNEYRSKSSDLILKYMQKEVDILEKDIQNQNI